MATSKLIKGDTLTETSNAADGFNPATEVSAYSYTSWDGTPGEPRRSPSRWSKSSPCLRR
ncbi:hypothetical protein [Klebsiella michiganensis]